MDKRIVILLYNCETTLSWAGLGRSDILSATKFCTVEIIHDGRVPSAISLPSSLPSIRYCCMCFSDQVCPQLYTPWERRFYSGMYIYIFPCNLGFGVIVEVNWAKQCHDGDMIVCIYCFPILLFKMMYLTINYVLLRKYLWS